MRRMRPEAPGRRPDARRQRSLSVLRDPPGPHLLGLRLAAHRRRDHRGRPGLRLVLPGSAAAMRALRPEPQDRQAGHGNRSRPVLWLLPGRDGGLLGLRADAALPADLLGQPDLPRLPGPSSPAVLPLRARPAGPGGMACRAGLRRLLRACPPPSRRMRAERARILLVGPGGDVPTQLHPLLEALTAVTNPATVVSWLGTSRSARLLGHLARTGGPITHALLDDLPQDQALHYVREALVSSGVLPARNEHLERLAAWLEHLLAGKPAHHTRLIRPFTHWFVLRRARRAAARRAFTRGSADFARARVLVALNLLSWVDQRGQVLRDLTQADLDQWLADGTTTAGPCATSSSGHAAAAWPAT